MFAETTASNQLEAGFGVVVSYSGSMRVGRLNCSASDRVFKCNHCGLEIDRDLNASIILEKAVS
jgi:transposase